MISQNINNQCIGASIITQSVHQSINECINECISASIINQRSNHQ